MNCKSRLIAVLFAIVLLPLSVKSQTIINGIINTYTKVTSIDAANIVTVQDAAGFKAGDTVLLIQMKGATIFTDATNRDDNTIIKMRCCGGQGN